MFFKHLIILFYISGILLFGSSCIRSEYLLSDRNIGKYEYRGSISGFASSSSSGAGYRGTASGNNIVKPIFVPKYKLEQMGILNLNNFLINCNTRKFSKATKDILLNKEADPVALDYLRAVLFILKIKNIESLQILKSCPPSLLDVDIKLLVLDNELELDKKNGIIRKNYFVKEYQKLLDEGNLSEEYEDVIDNRIKYLRYLN